MVGELNPNFPFRIFFNKSSKDVSFVSICSEMMKKKKKKKKKKEKEKTMKIISIKRE
jgi:hypothetical protein